MTGFPCIDIILFLTLFLTSSDLFIPVKLLDIFSLVSNDLEIPLILLALFFIVSSVGCGQ